MVKQKKPTHLSRYANLGTVKASTKKRPRKVRRPAWFWSLSGRKKLLVLALPVLAFLIITPIITYVTYANDISDKERLMNRNNTGIALQDKDGEVFYSIGKAERRNVVPLSEISEYTKEALIATEDKDFYKHGGFNVFSIVRAATTGVGGGSTITQQLAKNTLLTDERSFLRKYQELAMSIAIEQTYTKDEILTFYLNSVYYGENAFGIEDAAKAYYNKSPKELDLAESSMLIGILPAPSAYSPITGSMEYAKERQNTVLTRMVRNGYITESEKTSAIAQELSYGQGATNQDSIAPHFVEMVIKELSEKYGYEKVMRSGFQVKTTLDANAQKTLTDSVTGQVGYINGNGGSNASAIAIDPKTGQVRALVGSADYQNEQWGKVNMVTTARQPGSSFKPIYYSHALADGVITAAKVYKDEKTDFGGWTPQNATKQWYGDVSVRKALNWSLNIPSVKVMQDYTIDKSVAGAKALGIELDDTRDHDLTLSLGSEEVTLQQMTNAYAAFANEGKLHNNVIINEVNDKFGKSIYRSPVSVEKQAISKEGAYLISNILSDNQARSGIFGSMLTVAGHTAAVKTGTTDESRDAWTIGYTPSLAIGVWVGNNDNTPMLNGGAGMAGPIWRGSMQKLLSGQANEQFVMPSSIVQRTVCASNGGLANRSGQGTYSEYFMAGALPTESCTATPVMITVCNLSTNKQQSIDEQDFNESGYSKNLDDCKPKQIIVCDLETGKTVTINEEDYSETDYSRDTTNCKKPTEEPTTTQVCDTQTGTVVTLPSGSYDQSRYTTNTNNCQKKNTQPTTP